MATLYDVPDSFKPEMVEYQRIFVKVNRSTTGSYTYTNPNTSVAYTSASGGEAGVMALLKTALTPYLATASVINGKLDLSDFVNHPGYAVATGSANTYVVALSPVPTSLVDGFNFAVKINANNTGASTINPNTLGAKTIKNPDGTDTTIGDLKSGGIYTLRYNITTDTFILQGAGNSTNIQKNFTTQIQTELDANDTRFSGSKKADALCWSGQCIYANTSTGGTVALTNITIDSLRFLYYTLLIRLKSANNSLTTNAILVDVQKNVSGTFTSIATNYIKASDFTNTTDYQVFMMDFDYKGVKATNNQFKIVVTLQTQASAYEVDLDSIIIMPVGLGGFIS